jgi:hypothetical protein
MDISYLFSTPPYPTPPFFQFARPENDRRRYPNAFRELASISRDIRKVGWNKLPTGVERAGLIIINTRAHRNQQASKAALKMGKLVKYMETDLYYLLDPTVDEFIDLLRHFVTEVTEFLFIFTGAVRINQTYIDDPSEIKLSGGSVDPGLLFGLLNCKQEDSRVVFALDGVNRTRDWDPASSGVDRPGITFVAPYPDLAQATLDQFDSTQESLFALELTKIVKRDPEITGKNLIAAMNKELQPFGMKLFLASYPAAMATELSFVV